MIERSENKQAPWVIIDANEGDKACLAIMLAVAERLEKALADRAKGKKAGVYKGPVPEKDQYKKGILSEVDLTKSLEKSEYKEKLDKLQKSK